jgi:rod shape-determining protein MreD
MIKLLLRHIIRFIFLVIFQVLILNNIQYTGFLNPYLYILFILMLPFETPNWFLMILAFFLGLIIDLFSNTIGIHASATVFLAFLRPILLQIISPRDGYEPGTRPIIAHYGLGWYLKYTVILVLAHHFFLFFVEVFSFSDVHRTLIRILFSSSFTIVLIMISQLFILRRNK